jgi:hypothetical protein
MKTFAVLLLSLAFAIADADEYPSPAYAANEILSAILENVKLERHQIKVVVMTYDYVKRIWHVELMPSDRSCIDCFPSFFIKDGEAIVVEQLPHG